MPYRIEPCLGTVHCVLGQEMLLSQCPSTQMISGTVAFDAGVTLQWTSMSFHGIPANFSEI